MSWKPSVSEIAQDTVGGTISLIGSAFAAATVLAGASAEAIVSVSFFALSLLVALDWLAGIMRVLVGDYRTWRDTGDFPRSLSGRKMLDSPFKWIVYGVVTLAAALVVLLFQEAGFGFVGIGAIAFLHAVLGLQEALSIAGNLAVFPRVAEAFTHFLARFHIVAAERFAAGAGVPAGEVSTITEEELRAQEARRAGVPFRKPPLRATGSDN